MLFQRDIAGNKSRTDGPVLSVQPPYCCPPCLIGERGKKLGDNCKTLWAQVSFSTGNPRSSFLMAIIWGSIGEIKVAVDLVRISVLRSSGQCWPRNRCSQASRSLSLHFGWGDIWVGLCYNTLSIVLWVLWHLLYSLIPRQDWFNHSIQRGYIDPDD